MQLIITAQEVLSSFNLIQVVANSLPKSYSNDIAKILEGEYFDINQYINAVKSRDHVYFKQLNICIEDNNPTLDSRIEFNNIGDMIFTIDPELLPKVCKVLEDEVGTIVGLVTTVTGLFMTFKHMFMRIGDRFQAISDSYKKPARIVLSFDDVE